MDRPLQSSASSANSNRLRRRYNKRSTSNYSNANATTTVLLKVVVRNFKTLEEMEVKVAEMYSEGTFGVHFAFDEADWSVRIQAERAAFRAASEWKKQQLAQLADTANVPEEQNTEETTNTNTTSVLQGTQTISLLPAPHTSASSLKKSSVNSNGAQISVRTLYVVPPKHTSRQGKRLGLVYFVWTVLEPSNNDHKDRSMLYHALESLQATNPFLESQQSGSMIRVQEVANGKAWKEPTTFPSEVATVFHTEHYKQFIQFTKDRVQERMSRPKPIPGGGAVPLLNASANLAGSATTTTNEPVATLVQYLQQKHEEEKKRKAVRRKERKKKDEVVPSTNGSSSPKAALSKSETNGIVAVKKRSRRQRRKRNGKP